MELIPASASSSALQKLPVELFSTVVANLTVADLCNLRLACREVNHQIVKDFAKASFSHVEVEIDQQGLERLHNISRHTLFAARVQSLALTCASLVLNKWHGDPVVGEFNEEVAEYVRSDKWQKAFRDCLPGIHQLEKFTIRHPFRHKGSELKVWSPLVTIRHNGLASRWNTIVEKALSVMLSSEAALHELDVTEPGSPLFSIVSILRACRGRLGKLDAVERLALDPSWWNEPVESWPGYLADFQEVLCAPKRLESLSLSCEYIQIDVNETDECSLQLFECLGARAHLNHIAILHLMRASIHEKDLMNILAICKNTLKDLALHDIDLPDGSWDKVFRFLKVIRCLSDLRLADLWETRREMMISFTKIVAQRPEATFALSAKEEQLCGKHGPMYGASWELFGPCHLPGEDTFEIVYWWSLPSHQGMHCDMLHLCVKEGDDMEYWLEETATRLYRHEWR